ncbi:hypothetical protein KAZ66_00575 [Candidatus Woesebacteria bacterium]|nr:hypothetical protein [Candidatus Woesebacteria bacterium]
MDPRVEELFNWLADSIYRVIGIALIGLLLFVWGCDRTFFYPERMKAAAIAETTILLNQTDLEVTQIMNRFLNEKKWYAPSATITDLEKELLASKRALSPEIEQGAHWLLKKAAVEPDQYVAYDLTQQSQIRAKEASILVWQVNAKLEEMLGQRATVRQNLIDVSQNYTATLKILSAFVVRKELELQFHLSKHRKGLESTFNQLLQKSSEAEKARLQAIALMPPNIDTKGVGDAAYAQQELDHAKVLIDEMNVLMQQMTTTLDMLEDARLHVSERTAEANSIYTTTASYIEEIHTETSFWLKVPYETLASANKLRVLANTTLTTIVENDMVDVVKAYTLANQSIGASNLAKARADAEVADEAATKQAIDTYASRLVETNTSVSLAKQAKALLATYHHESTWLSVSTTIITATTTISESFTFRDRALSLIDLKVQQFAEGKTSASAALTKLDDAQKLAFEVVTLKDRLEGYRSQWSSAESQAALILSAEYANVQAYGAYDSGAVTAYNSAVLAFRTAQADASSKLYEQAIKDAAAAYNSALGTGSRALTAYNAEMRRRARATEQAIAEETSDAQAREAAQRAAEESARRASESSCCSSSGFSSSDSGSYSSSGSSSSDSDYGSSGSDSDYGGSGSDSDY